MHQNAFGGRSEPAGELTALSDPPAGFKGTEEQGVRGRREGEREGRRKGKGTKDREGRAAARISGLRAPKCGTLSRHYESNASSRRSTKKIGVLILVTAIHQHLQLCRQMPAASRRVAK